MSAESAGAVREETVKSGDRGIFVRSWQPSGAARAVVVLVHGFNSHSGYYIRTGEQLAARGFAAYALDLRGRGRSDGDRFYIESISEYVQDVGTVVSLAKLRHPGLPAFLLGHSAGGVTSVPVRARASGRAGGVHLRELRLPGARARLRHRGAQGPEPPRAARARPQAQERGLLTRSRRGEGDERRPPRSPTRPSRRARSPSWRAPTNGCAPSSRRSPCRC